MGQQGRESIKNPLRVDLMGTVDVDKFQYSVIGTITHMGEDNAGHNRAYLRQGSKWFLCDDYNLPVEKTPVDNYAEQNYCLLLKKCDSTSAKLASIPLKKCSVV